jgi:hypothetical protein
MSDLTEKIRSRGYWRFAIRPSTFEPDRVTYDALEGTVRRAAVRLRGWDVPHFENDGLIYGADFIGSETDWAHHLEAWRFYQSGQFVQLVGMKLDWADQSPMLTANDEGPRLGVTEALWTLSEVFELAARLATTPAGSDEMVVTVELGGLENRELFVDEARRSSFHETRRARIDTFKKELVLGREALLAEPDASAALAAREIFMRFGWTPDAGVLEGSQAELRRL